MEQKTIQEIAQALMAPKKGILAADESVDNMNSRLELIGVEGTDESRRIFREILLTSPDIEQYLTGVIFFDETLRQGTHDGRGFAELLIAKGIIPGIKVDKGKIPLPNFPHEEVTEGLDGLTERLQDYYGLGARFTKWRAVVPIGDGVPTDAAIRANAHAMARYAALVQEQGMVPIIEPEVLLDGNHTIEICGAVLRMTMRIVFEELARYRVDLSGLIVKTSMVLPGAALEKALPKDVAHETIAALTDAIPSTVAGVVFLSGGQAPEEATANLDAIARAPRERNQKSLPWPVTFSYSRALEVPALHVWRGDPEKISQAQKAFVERLKLNALAREGEYSAELEQSLD